MVAAFDAGLMIRVTGDIIALSPPLIIEPAHIDRLFTTLRGVLAKLA
jgi:beta-alanine--pyruvate transaminase